jgi:flagellar basal-body rod protein FlgC
VSLFGAIGISGTGIEAMQTWIDSDAANIANADDATSTSGTPYAEQIPEFAAVSQDTLSDEGSGVAVGVAASSESPIVTQDPSSPDADANGNVLLPDISLGDQLVGLVQAQEGYQANTSAIARALSAYQAGLQIGN